MKRSSRSRCSVRPRGITGSLALLAIMLVAASLLAEEITFLTWNLESGGSDKSVIADQLASLGPYDVLGLTEVDDDALEYFETALDSPAPYDILNTEEGGNDRIMLAYRSDELRLVDWEPIDGIGLVSYRPALWARLEHRETGTEFNVVVVHLARGAAGEEFSRWAQSRALRIWAGRRSRSPLVVMGDFNYDWHVETGAQDRGYVLLTERDLRWVRPAELVPTISGYPSVLDFIFVNAAANPDAWSSRILVRPGDFPDSDLTSDHRPVEAVWTVDR